MAYWIQETDGNHNLSNYRLFYCDTEIDVDDLPTNKKDGKIQDGDSVSFQKCAYGSECLVLESGNLYILSKDSDEWKAM